MTVWSQADRLQAELNDTLAHQRAARGKPRCTHCRPGRDCQWHRTSKPATKGEA